MHFQISARLRTILRSVASPFSAYKYTLLGSQNGADSRALKQLVKRRLSMLRHFLFYLGLPFSILLLYVNLSIGLVLSVPLLFLAIIFFFHSIENSLVYAYDEPEHARLLCEDPENYGFRTWELVKLFPDGKPMPMITGYLLLQDDPSVRPTSPTVLILHGNAGNIGHRLPFCRLLADHVQCNILIVDYRGYGRSSGKPTEPGLYADAKASLEFLLDRTDIAKDKLFLFGRSIGGAVAIWLTSHLRSAILRGVIIENSFTSLPEAAQHIFSKSFGSFARHLLPKALFINKYPALDLMREFVCRSSVRPRFLFISGSADDLIPPRMMQELAHVYRFSGSDNVNLGADCGSASPSSFLKDGKDGLVCFPGGQHNNTWLCPDWGNVVSHFIEQACACPSRTVFSGTI